MLSDFQTNASNARSICMNAGGRLAEISNRETQWDIIQYAV